MSECIWGERVFISDVRRSSQLIVLAGNLGCASVQESWHFMNAFLPAASHLVSYCRALRHLFFYLDEFVKRNCWGRLIVVVDYLLRTALRCLALTSHDRGGRFFSKDEMVDEMTIQMTWKEFWSSCSWPADRIWRWLLRRKKLVAPKRHDIS